MRKKICIGLGLLCFALGSIGAVLPVLPTTPFLLLASYCFARGSDRFYRWFTGTRLYRRHLDSFVKERAMTAKTKASILILASGMLILAFLMMDSVFGRAVILILMVAKYYYFLFRIRTIPGRKQQRKSGSTR